MSEKYCDPAQQVIDGFKEQVECLVGDVERLNGELTTLQGKFENRGHLMDAYIRALAEISDGRENPVEFARTVLRQGSKILVEVEKQRKKEEARKA